MLQTPDASGMPLAFLVIFQRTLLAPCTAVTMQNVAADLGIVCFCSAGCKSKLTLPVLRT
jgi:hypothetical protein